MGQILGLYFHVSSKVNMSSFQMSTCLNWGKSWKAKAIEMLPNFRSSFDSYLVGCGLIGSFCNMIFKSIQGHAVSCTYRREIALFHPLNIQIMLLTLTLICRCVTWCDCC